MFSVNFLLFIFIILLTNIYAQQLPNITPNISVCYPVPLGLDYLGEIQLQMGCQSLLPYTNEVDLRCCELEFEKKKGSTGRRHGCMAFLTSYIDNNRYQDIIDWIERGKEDRFESYSVFLGKTAYDLFQGFIDNNTKHTLYKLDCFSRIITMKYFLFIIFLFAIF